MRSLVATAGFLLVNTLVAALPKQIPFDNDGIEHMEFGSMVSKSKSYWRWGDAAGVANSYGLTDADSGFIRRFSSGVSSNASFKADATPPTIYDLFFNDYAEKHIVPIDHSSIGIEQIMNKDGDFIFTATDGGKLACIKRLPYSAPTEYYVSFVGLYFRKGRAVRWYKMVSPNFSFLKAFFVSPPSPANLDEPLNDSGLLIDALTGEWVAMGLIGKLSGDERFFMQFHEIEQSEMQPKFTEQQLKSFVVPKQLQDLCEEP